MYFCLNCILKRELIFMPHSYSDLGYIFADGNLPGNHQSFEKNHKCNHFCEFFKVPTNYGIWELQGFQLQPIKTHNYFQVARCSSSSLCFALVVSLQPLQLGVEVISHTVITHSFLCALHNPPFNICNSH